MSDININNLKWDTDLKRILLGKNYDEGSPIKNILMGKRDCYYLDNKDDYYLTSQGHLENYQVVEDVFVKLTNHKNTGYKDIMNSFWTIYKCLLQIEYPEYFRPFDNSKISIKQPPFISKINDKYITYYKSNKKDLILEENIDWIEFLILNFDKFEKVNKEVKGLKEFAVLTHTIGNITVVPAGFNSGRYSYDYWDYGLEKLKQFLNTFNSWEGYIEQYHMQAFLDSAANPMPLQKDHLTENKLILPDKKDTVEYFLSVVNKSIEKRGKIIIEKINSKDR